MSDRKSDRLTILIPTFERPEKLKRYLTFLSDTERFSRQLSESIPFELRVLDGSTQAQKTNQQICEEHGVTHRTFDPKQPPRYRTAAILPELTSEFVVLAADDDFLCPQGLAEAIHFLQYHPEYVSAHGKYSSFVLKADGIPVLKPLHPTLRSISLSDSHHRLFDFLSHYVPIHYAVHRRQAMMVAYQVMENHLEPIPTRFAELLLGCSQAIQGKIKALDSHYNIRDGQPSKKKNAWNWAKQITDSSFYPLYSQFKAALQETFDEHPGRLDMPITDLIDYTFFNYLKNQTGPAPLTQLQNVVFKSPRKKKTPWKQIQAAPYLNRLLLKTKESSDLTVHRDIKPITDFLSQWHSKADSPALP